MGLTIAVFRSYSSSVDCEDINCSESLDADQIVSGEEWQAVRDRRGALRLVHCLSVAVYAG